MKKFQLLQILNELSIKHLIKLTLQEYYVKLLKFKIEKLLKFKAFKIEEKCSVCRPTIRLLHFDN